MNDVESFITDAAPAVAVRAAVRVRVRGLVQGVGFRPFVYRLARECGLVGWVRNDAQGVLIHAEGTPQRLTRFREALVRAAPAAASVSDVIAAPASLRAFAAFRILPSPKEAGRAAATRVPPDRAACSAWTARVCSLANFIVASRSGFQDGLTISSALSRWTWQWMSTVNHLPRCCLGPGK